MRGAKAQWYVVVEFSAGCGDWCSTRDDPFTRQNVDDVSLPRQMNAGRPGRQMKHLQISRELARKQRVNSRSGVSLMRSVPA